jgi:hypothetical protein
MSTGPTLPAGYGRSKICKGLPVGAARPVGSPSRRDRRDRRDRWVAEGGGAPGTRTWRQMCVSEVAPVSAVTGGGAVALTSVGGEAGAMAEQRWQTMRALRGLPEVTCGLAGDAGLPTGSLSSCTTCRPLADTGLRGDTPGRGCRCGCRAWLMVRTARLARTPVSATHSILRRTGCLLGGCELQPGRRGRSDVDGKRRGNAHLDSQRECPRS